MLMELEEQIEEDPEQKYGQAFIAVTTTGVEKRKLGTILNPDGFC